MDHNHNDMRTVEIKKFDFNDGTFTAYGCKYAVTDLVEASKDLPIFDLQLCAIDLSARPWGEMNIYSFIGHAQRVQDADEDFPVLMTPEGYICDGWHRVVRAIINKKTTIPARRLNVLPEPINQ